MDHSRQLLDMIGVSVILSLPGFQLLCNANKMAASAPGFTRTQKQKEVSLYECVFLPVHWFVASKKLCSYTHMFVHRYINVFICSHREREAGKEKHQQHCCTAHASSPFQIKTWNLNPGPCETLFLSYFMGQNCHMPL